MATVAQLQKQLAALQAQLESATPAPEKRAPAPRPWDGRRVKVVKGCFSHTPKGATAPNKYRALTLAEAHAAIDAAYAADWVYATRA